MRAGGRGSGSLVHAIRRSAWTTVLSLGALATIMLGAGVLDVLVLEPRLQRTLDALGEARRAHVAMLDQQSGLRGALLTGEPGFLQAHDRGRRRLGPANAAVTQLAGQRDGTMDVVLDWRLAQQAWLDGWADSALQRVGEADAADALDGDKPTFDRYRAQYERLEGALEAERDQVLQARRLIVRGVAGGALLGAVVTLVLALRRHRRLEEHLTAILTELHDRLERAAALDLSPNGTLEGPEELRDIAHGLELMIGELRSSRGLAEERSEQLADRARQLHEVVAFARDVAGRLNLRYVLRGVGEAASAVAGRGRVLVWLMSEDGEELSACADSTGPGGEPLGVDPVALGDGLVGEAGRFGRTTRGTDPTELIVPMVVGARVIGVLQFCDLAADALTADTEEVVEMLAVQAGTAIEAARLHELTATMARTDALTRLPNRRRFDEDLQTEVATAERYGRPLALVMLDADEFKSFNDTFGHPAGDVVLQRLGTSLAADLRASDTAYRYGGEEFALILRESTLDAAMHLAERLRARVEARLADEPRPVTISVGVAALPEHGSGADALMAAADAALYSAKRAGRNQVAAAPAESVSGRV